MGIDDVMKSRKEAHRAFRVEFEENGDAKVFDRSSGELVGWIKGRLAHMMIMIGAHGAKNIAAVAMGDNN